MSDKNFSEELYEFFSDKVVGCKSSELIKKYVKELEKRAERFHYEFKKRNELEQENKDLQEKVDMADGIIDAHIKKMDKLQYKIKNLKEIYTELESSLVDARLIIQKLKDNRHILEPSVLVDDILGDKK